MKKRSDVESRVHLDLSYTGPPTTGGHPLGTLRFAARQSRPTEVLDLTSRTGGELHPLVPPCEAAFQAPMAHGRLDGKPRPARREATDQHGPRPTPEARLVCILVSVQTSPRQVGQGRLLGMGQRQAQQWSQVLWGVRRAARRALGDAPTRSLAELALRLGMAEAEAAALVEPTEAVPPTSALPTAALLAPASPL